MRYINLKEGKIVLSFSFDPMVVAVVRSIDGRVWNASLKQWEIPKENAEEAIALLSPLGFITHPNVLALQHKAREETAFIDEIKSSLDQPYTGSLPLLDFQRKGTAFLKKMPSALLGDVPGLGKTLQTIAALEDEKKVLWFTFSSLKFTTEEEIKKWIPDEKIIVIDGTKKQRAEKWVFAKDPRFKYVIANYDLLIHDLDLFKDLEWPIIVCDEATRISNPEAKSVQALKALKSRKRIALTGTPISNGPGDIYSIIDWVAPGFLGTYYQFKQKYCIMDIDYNRVVGYKSIAQLSAKVDRYMLRRTKDEVLKDLPPKTLTNVVFDLSEKEREVYSSIRDRVIEEIKKLSELDTRSLAIAPVKMLRLKQCTDHVKLVDVLEDVNSTKLTILKEMLKPIVSSGEKAIIFTQFAEMLEILSGELEEFRPALIYGAVTSEDRMRRVKEFNDDPNGRIIIMTEAGAYGLNMQSASYVFHYDSPWSIAKLTQREDRAHRHGQKKPVTVYNLIARNSVDEYVVKVLHKKNKVSVDILKDAERLEDQGLSLEDIEAILRL